MALRDQPTSDTGIHRRRERDRERQRENERENEKMNESDDYE